MKNNTIIFNNVGNFGLSVTHSISDAGDISRKIDSHIHEQCEIYVNIKGNVAFMVEDSIYDIEHGDIIIARPFEYHHCIYRDDSVHEHFWILFSPGGNESLLKPFFDRKAGEKNHIRLPLEKKQELISVCENLSDGNTSDVKNLSLFWTLISLIESGKNHKDKSARYPKEFSQILGFLDENYKNISSVKEFSLENHMSINTLERQFMKYTGLKPKEYIIRKKLSEAARLLSQEDVNVSDAAWLCGFSDCSYFIVKFKQHYGITPYKYKMQMQI